MSERGQEDEVKETIILVHGTWAAPMESTRQWHQLHDGADSELSFAAKLDAALERHGSQARCWAHEDGGSTFAWAGTNSWIDRTHGASSLAETIKALQAENWKCHIVAHSHGGNVLTEAVFPAWRTLAQEWQGQLVTLGTPFLDTVTDVRGREERRKRTLSIAGWCSWGLIVLMMLGLGVIIAEVLWNWPAEDPGVETPFGKLSGRYVFYLILAVVFAPLLIAPVLAYRRRRGRILGWNGFWERQLAQPTRLLALNSPFDEAWQVLHHVRTSANPFSPRMGLLRFLSLTRRRVLARHRDIDRIAGFNCLRDLSFREKGRVLIYWLFPPSLTLILLGLLAVASSNPDVDVVSAARLIGQIVFGMVLFMIVGVMGDYVALGRRILNDMGIPLRWMRGFAASIAALPSAAVTYFVRERVWSVMQEAACGLEGYRHKLPAVDKVPGCFPDAFSRYENISVAAEARALARRNAWMGEHFGTLSETFSKLVVTASDVEALLKTVSNDLSLVHAAYYTDDECIDRIARWIAGKG
ncbi:hypothetical protein [Hyphomicrobium sp. CS1BSMeth3]|uniref:hypothetical protein n=1 Tax=Hyphomicrobium sp. CS1BSMeth3 TaxID=1892844 RepID=UPI00093024A1|nr:hypothetical protein [Hyphomicrobium sp. CS1BSMeth3]